MAREAERVDPRVVSEVGEADRVEPILCLVTDSRRLLLATGGAERNWQSLLERQVEGAVRAGIQFVQIRERSLPVRDLLALTHSLVALAAGSATQILVNDRLDVVLSVRANGVHLRADSPSPGRVRSAGGADFFISRAVHSADDVLASYGADVFVAGTMFLTSSKADKQTWLGRSGLAAIVQAAGAMPVLAIGGVTAHNASEVVVSGGRGLASIGGFIPAEPGTDVRRFVERQAERYRAAFSAA